MRTGKIKVIKPKIIKPFDRLYEVNINTVIIVTSISQGIVYGTRISNPNSNISDNPLKTRRDDLVSITLMDTRTEEEFKPIEEQLKYLYRAKDNDKDVKFFQVGNPAEKIIAMAADKFMIDKLDIINPIATMYGRYVAECKLYNMAATEFKEWYAKNAI